MTVQTHNLLTVAVLGLFCSCRRDSSDAEDLQKLRQLESAAAQAGHCLTTHVVEGMRLNLARKFRYAQASEGRTLPVSDALLLMEKVMNFSLPVLEWSADSYRKSGVPLFCRDVVSLTLAPPFMERVPPPAAPLAENQKVGGWGMAFSLNGALFRGWSELDKQLDEELQRLSAAPAYNCLVRHFVESTLRSTRLLPKYQAEAKAAQAWNPELLMSVYVLSQIYLLPAAVYIDNLAAPLQAEGIPILCNDVPPIPVNP